MPPDFELASIRGIKCESIPYRSDQNMISKPPVSQDEFSAMNPPESAPPPDSVYTSLLAGTHHEEDFAIYILQR